MTKFFAGQEVFDQNSYANSIRRAGRLMTGHSPYLLMNEVSDETADALADYANLTGNDRTSEAKLSEANAKLLAMLVQLRSERNAAPRGEVQRTKDGS